jgi:asparagine synthase (glutamine-hydrolysing)
MCGIAGIFSINSISNEQKSDLNLALKKMQHRGPDHSALQGNEIVQLGHTRLSIIDTSTAANQPMYSENGKYALVFNGEIFNFKSLKVELEKFGLKFKTHSDTEVLLQLLIKSGKAAISQLNGFFAFAFYDFEKNEIWLARDRFGEKPLKYSYENGTLYFASDLNGLKTFHPKAKINLDALQLYFQYNYIPAPFTIYDSIYKLMPGEIISVNKSGLTKENYFEIKNGESLLDEKLIKITLKEVLEDAVKLRMIADVPIGSFLSGGIDSTIITGIAKDFDSSINSFSIGFPDEKHFDETPFALKAAKHLKTHHEVFEVTSKNLLANMEDVISKMDEPFADSSALAVYELSKRTKQKITVALSGDGADELFGGYHKHLAHQKAAKKTISNLLLKNSSGVWKLFKGSRNSQTGDKIRKAKKYSTALKLNPVDRYIRWASVLSIEDRRNLFNKTILSQNTNEVMEYYFKSIEKGNDLNEILLADIKLVLANDMLVKTDMMSMANSLEVRPPFLDHRIVDLSMRIPENFKIKNESKKNILKETFSNYLPEELMHRPKKGFEVPLHSWFNGELKSKIESEWLNEKMMNTKSIFNPDYLKKLKANVFSNNPGDSPATVWAMIVLQEWLKNNKMEL